MWKEALAGPGWKELIPDAARILARLFGSSELLEKEEARDAVQSLYPVNPMGLEQYLDDPDRFLDAWNRQKELFIGSLGLVSLEESIYKAWTKDGHHQLNGTRGMASGDSCAHMQMVLQRYGMALNPREGLAADHLAVIRRGVQDQGKGFRQVLEAQGNADPLGVFVGDTLEDPGLRA